jgi:hypothetical protein
MVAFIKSGIQLTDAPTPDASIATDVPSSSVWISSAVSRLFAWPGTL